MIVDNLEIEIKHEKEFQDELINNKFCLTRISTAKVWFLPKKGDPNINCFTGISTCRYPDKFNKKKGARTALQRALKKAGLDRNRIKSIFAKFFVRHTQSIQTGPTPIAPILSSNHVMLPTLAYLAKSILGDYKNGFLCGSNLIERMNLLDKTLKEIEAIENFNNDQKK